MGCLGAHLNFVEAHCLQIQLGRRLNPFLFFVIYLFFDTHRSLSLAEQGTKWEFLELNITSNLKTALCSNVFKS